MLRHRNFSEIRRSILPKTVKYSIIDEIGPHRPSERTVKDMESRYPHFIDLNDYPVQWWNKVIRLGKDVLYSIPYIGYVMQFSVYKKIGVKFTLIIDIICSSKFK